jgi:hypothetical protein
MQNASIILFIIDQSISYRCEKTWVRTRARDAARVSPSLSLFLSPASAETALHFLQAITENHSSIDQVDNRSLNCAWIARSDIRRGESQHCTRRALCKSARDLKARWCISPWDRFDTRCEDMTVSQCHDLLLYRETPRRLYVNNLPDYLAGFLFTDARISYVSPSALTSVNERGICIKSRFNLPTLPISHIQIHTNCRDYSSEDEIRIV